MQTMKQFWNDDGIKGWMRPFTQVLTVDVFLAVYNINFTVFNAFFVRRISWTTNVTKMIPIQIDREFFFMYVGIKK